MGKIMNVNYDYDNSFLIADTYIMFASHGVELEKRWFCGKVFTFFFHFFFICTHIKYQKKKKKR